MNVCVHICTRGMCSGNSCTTCEHLQEHWTLDVHKVTHRFFSSVYQQFIAWQNAKAQSKQGELKSGVHAVGNLVTSPMEIQVENKLREELGGTQQVTKDHPTNPRVQGDVGFYLSPPSSCCCHIENGYRQMKPSLNPHKNQEEIHLSASEVLAWKIYVIMPGQYCFL